MGILKIAFILFVLIFPFAEIGRVQFSSGVAVSLNDVFLFSVVLIWAVNKFVKKPKLNPNYLTKPLLLFSGIAFISLLLNFNNLSLNNFFISFLYLVRWIFYALLYFIVRDFDIKFRFKISLSLLFSGSLVILIGYIQYFLYPNLGNLYYLGWDEHLYRMFSTFLDPNFAGTFFVIFFLFSLGFVQKYFNISRLKLLLSTVISVSSLIAVYLTYSRSALLMLLISMVIFLILIKKGKFLFIFAVIFIILLFASPKSFKTEGTNVLRITSSEARTQSLKQGTDIFLSSPVFGVGFNAYRYAQNKRGLDNIYWQVTHAGAGTDNSFIFVLATTGVVGFTSYLYLIYKIFNNSYKNYKKNIFALILLSLLPGLIINSFFINSLFYVLIIEWVWILAAFTESN